MADSRTIYVLDLVAREAARRGGRVNVRDVCAAAVGALPVDGAGVSAMSNPALRHILHATDRTSGELEELQLTLGEGPCVDAIVSGAPVLSGDLSAAETLEQWPVFAPAAHAAGACALFALPLGTGSRTPGVLDLYSVRAGTLEGEVLADALAFAETATALMLPSPGHAAGQGGAAAVEEMMGFDRYRAEVDQAVGILTEQLEVGPEEAAVRLRAYAYARSMKVADLAVQVVARRLRFDPDGAERVREEE